MTARIVRLTACAMLLSWSAAGAQIPQPTSNEGAPVVADAGLTPGTQPAQLTAEDLGAFLDGMLPSSVAIGDIAGATVSVVKDDAVLLTRGKTVRAAGAALRAARRSGCNRRQHQRRE